MTKETNEEKAQKISEDFYMPDTGFNREDLYDAAIEMAQWKDQQFKKYLEECIKTCEKSEVPVTKLVFEAIIKDLKL